MREAHIVEIQTPRKYMLNGAWFGTRKPRTVYIWLHGLGSSMFSKMDVMQLLARKDTAVLAFNNRGHDKISILTQVKRHHSKRRFAGGGAEIFTECIDDIDGAIRFAKKSGAKNIFLVGHSTGCQKAVYWASKRNRGAKGIVLLAPVSDYAAIIDLYGKNKVESVAKYARALVKKGKPHELIPLALWPHEVDTAQRFLSLYTPDSVEEIFTYIQKNKVPRTLWKVRMPILACIAELDEFGVLPAKEIALWFRRHLNLKSEVSIIRGAGHSFKGAEKKVAHGIRTWAVARG